MPQFLLALVTLFVGLWIINRFASGLDRAFERGDMEATLRKFIRNLISIGLEVLLLISVASMVGIATTSLIAVQAGDIQLCGEFGVLGPVSFQGPF